MKKWGVLLVVAAAWFIFALDTTMMNVAITDITQDLNTEIQYVQFAIALYALVIAAVILLGAKLATIYGAKRIFIIGVILFASGMSIASVSQNIAMLTVGWSVITGLGAALIVPTGVILLMENYEGKARAVAFAVFSAVYVGSAAIGPLIGGAFTTYLSWRWAFLMVFVLDVIILVSSRLVKGQKGSRRAKVDMAGVLLSAVGFVSVVLGVICTTSYGWWEATKPLVIGGVEIAPFGLSIAPVLMITGAIFLLLFVLWERRQGRKGREPLLPFSLIKDRPYMAGVGVAAIVNVSYGALFFCIPLFVQSVLFLNAMQSGLILMPLTIALLVISLVTPRLAARVPAKYLSIVGIAIAIIGTVVLANSFSADMAVTAMIPGFIVYGLGIGLAVAQLQNLTLSSVKPSETNEGTGLFNGLRNLGWSIGTAVVGTLLITFLLSGLVAGINGSAVLPQADKDELTAVVTESTTKMDREDLEAQIEAADYPDEYKEELVAITSDAVGHSMRVTFYTLAGILGVGLVASLFLSRRKLVPTAGGATVPPT
ncbi:MAG: MFS transporter [Dehalococcoidales bacterium]|nr:MFS transporter [Dehalococcoidales bacterium]